MRIVTQDGLWDIPYEEVVIQRYEKCIYFVNRNYGGNGESAMLAAKYSSKDEAEKVMELLHKEWIERGAQGFFKFPGEVNG